MMKVSMKKRTEKKGIRRRAAPLLSLILTVLTVLSLTVLSLTSCQKKIKDITPYLDEFQRLIEASFEINEVLYGEGLPVYSRNEGIGEMYYSEETNALLLSRFREAHGSDYPEGFFDTYQSKFRLYYWIYEDKAYGETVLKYRALTYETKEDGYGMKAHVGYLLVKDGEDISLGTPVHTGKDGKVFYPLTDESYKEPEAGYLYSPTDNVFYDVVRADAPFTDIDSIKTAAEKVYSKAYLNSVYGVIFDGVRSDYGEEDGQGAILLARYLYEQNEDGSVYLKKCNLIKPLFEKQRTYDYSSMQQVKPYRADQVSVEIRAYGVYLNDSFESVEGWHTVRLSFLLENGEWRLDAPTY